MERPSARGLYVYALPFLSPPFLVAAIRGAVQRQTELTLPRYFVFCLVRYVWIPRSRLPQLNDPPPLPNHRDPLHRNPSPPANHPRPPAPLSHPRPLQPRREPRSHNAAKRAADADPESERVRGARDGWEGEVEEEEGEADSEVEGAGAVETYEPGFGGGGGEEYWGCY